MIILFALAILPLSYAEMPPGNVTADPETQGGRGMVIKTVGNLRFEVPEDMPIEKKHNIIAPISVDDYVYVKFSELESRLTKIEEAITKINQELSSIAKDAHTTLESHPVVSIGPEESGAPALKE